MGSMLDLPSWFWYAFSAAVFIVANTILWVYMQHCKVKGIKPPQPFPWLKKYKKRISLWSDLFIIAFVVLYTFFYDIFLNLVLRSLNSPVQYQPADIRPTLSIVFLVLMNYSTWTFTLVSFLSCFQENITRIKRLVLSVMCCIPLTFGIVSCVLDNVQGYTFYIKVLPMSLFPIVFLNWPAILLGQPFFEFFPKLLRKIPLPWFHITDYKE